MTTDATLDEPGRAYRRIVWAIVAGVLLLAIAEAAAGWAMASAQLLKDAGDWSYTVLLYGIAAYVFGKGTRAERSATMAIAGILAFAGFHTLYDLWATIREPRQHDVEIVEITAAAATVVAYAVAISLCRFRRCPNPLIRATWVSSRNDAIATTVASIATVVVAGLPSRWPEHAFDLLGAGLAFQACYATLRASRMTGTSGEASEAAGEAPGR